MKVLFLDMDGVVVTRRPGIAESKLVDNLRYIIEQTDAKIVLSTDWRRTPAARAEVKRILNAHGGMDYIGWTATNTSITMNHRPMEILNWVRERNKKVKAEGWSDEELVEAFVAIDDRALLTERGGDRLHGHFVQTHPTRGLTKNAAEEVIKLFANPWQDKVKTPSNPPEGLSSMLASTHITQRTPVRSSSTLTPGQAAILQRKAPPTQPRVTAGARAAMVVTGAVAGRGLPGQNRLSNTAPAGSSASGMRVPATSPGLRPMGGAPRGSVRTASAAQPAPYGSLRSRPSQ